MLENLKELWMNIVGASPLLILLFKNEIMAWWQARSIFLDREYDDGDPEKPDFCKICGPDGSWASVIIFQYTRPKPFRRLLGKIKKSWGMGGVYFAIMRHEEDAQTDEAIYTLQYRHLSMIAWSQLATSHMQADEKRLWRYRIEKESDKFDMACQPWGAPFSLTRYGVRG